MVLRAAGCRVVSGGTAGFPEPGCALLLLQPVFYQLPTPLLHAFDLGITLLRAFRSPHYICFAQSRRFSVVTA